MVSSTHTVSLTGIAATTVQVQVQLTGGDPGIQVIGLPAGAVRESQSRVRGAFHAMGLRLPAKKITINLAPADLQKDGSHYDLPIAVALLMACGILPQDAAENAHFYGELNLDASLNAVSGALPAAIHARGDGAQRFFVSAQNAPEAAWAQGEDQGHMAVFGVAHLGELVRHLQGEESISPAKPVLKKPAHALNQLDLRDIRGQEQAKRAAEIAAAGGHNMMLMGPPGSGKSMLARRMPGLMPSLSPEEALDVSSIHSVAGLLPDDGLVTQRPFRDPHHSASAVALCGGGLKAKPGEMSLAHRGVLFLDELPEFPRQVLETLRQPLETGDIRISRANRHVLYPARFQLITAMNPCPCGYDGDPTHRCRCSDFDKQRYAGKISGPLMDRIDLHVAVPAVKIDALDLPPAKESSADVAARVAEARHRQAQRLAGTGLHTNAELQGELLDAYATPTAEARQMLQQAAQRYKLSARAYHRILKVARTVADLKGDTDIAKPHVGEALMFRQM